METALFAAAGFDFLEVALDVVLVAAGDFLQSRHILTLKENMFTGRLCIQPGSFTGSDIT